jgi:hypothetical protein
MAIKKTSNQKTGLTSPSPKADKTTEPQNKATRKAENEKRITENVANGFTKAPLRDDVASTIDNPCADDDNAGMVHYRRADSRWSTDGKMEDKQPRSGPGKYREVQTLGVMPDQVLGAGPSGNNLQQPKGQKETKATVQVGQWSFDNAQSVFNDQ